MRFRKLLSASMCSAIFMLMGTSSMAFNMPPDGKGKYCDTPSRCVDPMAMNGMVTSSHYLATQAGLDVLRKGGNAVDATIAVASTLAVVYPQMNSIGGDNFWLIYNAKTGELKALNASNRAGQKATIQAYKAQNLQKIPACGYLAANTVPGVISGWDEAYQYAHKTMEKSLPWKSVLEFSIKFAEQGFPVSHSLYYWTAVNIDEKDQEFRNLQRFPEFKRIFLKKDGNPYAIGEILKQPDLANTLKIIADKGGRCFL